MSHFESEDTVEGVVVASEDTAQEDEFDIGFIFKHHEDIEAVGDDFEVERIVEGASDFVAGSAAVEVDAGGAGEERGGVSSDGQLAREFFDLARGEEVFVGSVFERDRATEDTPEKACAVEEMNIAADGHIADVEDAGEIGDLDGAGGVEEFEDALMSGGGEHWDKIAQIRTKSRDREEN